MTREGGDRQSLVSFQLVCGVGRRPVIIQLLHSSYKRHFVMSLPVVYNLDACVGGVGGGYVTTKFEG